MKKWHVFAIASLLAATPALAETMTNDSVIGLSAAGLGDDVIVAKIKASDASFDLSTLALTGLKAKGLSNAVITAMIERSSAKEQSAQSIDSPDPMVPHPIGLYLLDDSVAPPKMIKVDPSGSSQVKIGNTLGYAFSYGIAPMTVKVSLNGEAAHIVVPSHRPIFYLFTAQSQQHQGAFNPYSMMANAAFWTISSPNEFSLARLIPKSGHREAKIGNYSVTGAQTGVMDKDRVEFKYETIKDGVFKVTTSEPIGPGEYAFVKGVATVAIVFDFSVR